MNTSCHHNITPIFCGLRRWRFYQPVTVLFLFTAMLLLGISATKASTTEVIYSFAGDEDGEYADTDVAIDGAGNLYGSTVLGGDFGSGTVWQLAPSGTSWMHTVLYSFTSGTDGGEPYKGVTVDAQGNLYGIHAFTGGDDGSGPGARVAVDPQGNVYGMTPTGGAFGLGTIYQLHPRANGNYTFKVIHTFTGGTDGSSGSAGKMILRNGYFYGAATTGGAFGSGTVFELTPTPTGEWDFRTLYSFRGQPDGVFPYGALLFDRSGNIFGTTYYGGVNGLGAVYQLAPRPTGEWRERVLYSFAGGGDGNSPISQMNFDSVGNLYGTTSEGGLGSGTIFKLTRGQDGSWVESLPHLFQGPPDAAFPYSGMSNRGGSFYGATTHGGDDDEGAIYKFTP